MNRQIAVCIRCGFLKKRPFEKCPTCGLPPATRDEKVKSLILSNDYYLPEEDYLGKSNDELIAIGQAINKGQPYEFDQIDLKRVNDYFNEAEAITGTQLVWSYLVWIGPGLLLLLILAIFVKGDPRGWF